MGERPYRLDRVLTQLIQSGTLDGVAGIVIGQLSDCTEANAAYGPLEVVADVLAPLDVPVLAELPIGHDPSSRSFLHGGLATLDVSDGVLTVRHDVADA